MEREERYERNRIWTPKEQEELGRKRVAVIGCGGLGGYIIEMLGRMGIGHIVACDGDVFVPSNLNRQLLSTEALLGASKAQAAADRMHLVNSETQVTVKACFLTEETGPDILKGCDVAVDALDNPGAKRLLQRLCRQANIPMVHGAIGGWFGQVTTILPGDDTLDHLYREDAAIPSEAGNPPFTPAAAAAVEVGEVVKLLLGKGTLLRGQVLMIDLLNGEFETVEL